MIAHKMVDRTGGRELNSRPFVMYSVKIYLKIEKGRGSTYAF